jgi:hypothetical protein
MVAAKKELTENIITCPKIKQVAIIQLVIVQDPATKPLL